jgi:hypothetical protein
MMLRLQQKYNSAQLQSKRETLYKQTNFEPGCKNEALCLRMVVKVLTGGD